MNEQDALVVTAVRAIETSDRDHALWSDSDRAWASRAAAEIVGEGASPGAYLARRARLASERLGERYPPLAKAMRALQWRSWVGVAIVVLAFVVGIAIDRIGAGQRINVLAPPVLGLLAWNLAVYVLLLASPLLRAGRGGDTSTGPLRHAVVRIAGGIDRLPRRGARGALGAAIESFAGEWSRRATPLYNARAARILHLAAAALAAGVLAGLYLRGLAFEYRATWESTFLDAATVHRILSFVLAPGTLVTGIEVPSVDALTAMRSGAAPASENAARWLHLIAATVAVVVIVPRLLLGIGAGLIERYRRARVDVELADPYFQRLLRGFHGGPVRVKVVPYSYRVPPASLAGLQAVIARAFGGSAALVCTSPVGYGEEETLPPSALPDGAGPAIALFNLAATPEREAHGRFVDALRGAAAGHPVLLLIDEAPFTARSEVDAKRLEERRAVWTSQFAERGVEPVFANLGNPDLAAVEAAIESRLGDAKA